MTENETIDFINNIKSQIIKEKGKHLDFPPSYILYLDYIEMCDMAIDSLNSKSNAEEYRTPKKPIPDEYGWAYHCPTCGQLIGDFTYFQYCPACGQALDWKGDENDTK